MSPGAASRAGASAGRPGASAGAVFRGGTEIRVRVPSGFDLARDVCSYGYFLLAPNRWVPAERALYRPLVAESGTDGGGPVAVRVTQVGVGEPLRVRCSRRLDRAGVASVRRQLGRMLDLGVDDAAARAFHAVDPRWRRGGRCRLFRSPTLFEDVIKTVTSCNVAWPSTMRMNERLCAVLGRPAAGGPRGRPGGGAASLGVAGRTFPDAGRLARTREGTLRSRCVVGYRDRRIVALARGFAAGRFETERGPVDVASIADPGRTDGEVYEDLLKLPGIGPYAAANVMQLLGRYGRVPIDTETVRDGRVVLGMEGGEADLKRRLAAHYEAYGEHAFRSYWFELWRFYQERRGPAETWDRETTGRTFTASALK